MADVNYCVVGAGFAGLTAALRLKQAGESVALLEARDRVGGRTFTEVSDDGVWIDRGGAWIGPGQNRIKALMTEYGVPSYKQYSDGKAMMVLDGKQHRYSGTVPLTMTPWVSANLGAVFLELGQMCKSIPLEAPWEAKNAQKWDQITLAKWLAGNTVSKAAHDLLESSFVERSHFLMSESTRTRARSSMIGIGSCLRCCSSRVAACPPVIFTASSPPAA